jgi:Ser/Thr protein kinase RdoA (MazF antagonist)
VSDWELLQVVLSFYSPLYQIRDLEPLGNAGGFSGARLWKVTTPAGVFAVRRWPPGGPTPGQLQQMHSVLERVVMAGINYVPLPVRTSAGNTWVEHNEGLWQMEPWLPGTADFWRNPSSARLKAVMEALAKFHLTAASVAGRGTFGVSPSLTRRQQELQEMLGPWLDDVLSPRVPAGKWPELDAHAQELLARLRRVRVWASRLLNVSLPKVPLQPVIRDIWHDHILFEGDRVTGIVDFGCLGIDSVAVDLSRLIGSLVGEDLGRVREALAEYEKLRPLSPVERWLTQWGRCTGAVGGGLVWLRRHYVEGLVWDRRPGILHRLRHFIQRLDQLVQSGLPSPTEELSSIRSTLSLP